MVYLPENVAVGYQVHAVCFGELPQLRQRMAIGLHDGGGQPHRHPCGLQSQYGAHGFLPRAGYGGDVVVFLRFHTVERHIHKLRLHLCQELHHFRIATRQVRHHDKIQIQPLGIEDKIFELGV